MSVRRPVVVLVTTLLAVALPPVWADAVPADRERTPAPPAGAREPSRPDARLVLGRGPDGRVRLLATTPGSPLARPDGVPAGASPERVARAFLDRHGRLLGLPAGGGSGLRLVAAPTGPGGPSVVRLRQQQGGVPVIGGELVVSLDAAGSVVSANGETAAPRNLPPPAVAAGTAGRTAVAAAARASRAPLAALRVGAPALRGFDPALLGAPGRPGLRLVWQVEVRGPGVRQLVLVDAGTGAVALRVDRLAHARDRRVCDHANARSGEGPDCPAPGHPVVRGETGPASPVGDVESAFALTGAAYDFYRDLGRDSIDGRGMPLVSTVRWCAPPSAGGSGECPMRNAFWDGRGMVFGAGFPGADDVVAHELTHGVTEHTSGLAYYHQSGAISESLSDVAGELVDLRHGPDAPADRWALGEDLPGGKIRDLRDPAFAPPGGLPQPDRMTSPRFLADPDLVDSGAVHVNSGVGNKAAYLVVDGTAGEPGGAFNGRRFPGIGAEKAARVYYRVQALLTSGSDYADLYHLLPQACAQLVGSAGITGTDCATVSAAVGATEMNLQPRDPAARAPEAPYCPPGTATRRTVATYDHETPGPFAGTGTWRRIPAAGAPFSYATSGTRSLWAQGPSRRSTSTLRLTEPIVVPAAPSTWVRFAHAFDLDHEGASSYDAARVDYSVDAGRTWRDAGPLFAGTGYNTAVVGSRVRGFGGSSHGYVSSRLDLTGLAGRSVHLRWRLDTDDQFASDGWFVDDTVVYTCRSATPSAPRSPRVTGTSGTAALTWATSAWGGTGAVTGHVVTLRPRVEGAATRTLTLPASARRTVLTGLRGGVGYDVSVAARNASGAGAAARTRLSGTAASVRATPSTLAYGAATGLTVTLAHADTRRPVAGARVTVHRRAQGTTAWSAWAAGVTRADGRLVLAAAPGLHHDYTARFAGGQGTAASTSSPRRVWVERRVSASWSRTSLPRGAAVRVSGSARPGVQGTRVTLQRRVDGRWTDVGGTRLTGSGRFALSLRPGRRSATYRVQVAGDQGHRAGRSRPVTITTY